MPPKNSGGSRKAPSPESVRRAPSRTASRHAREQLSAQTMSSDSDSYGDASVESADESSPAGGGTSTPNKPQQIKLLLNFDKNMIAGSGGSKRLQSTKSPKQPQSASQQQQQEQPTPSRPVKKPMVTLKLSQDKGSSSSLKQTTLNFPKKELVQPKPVEATPAPAPAPAPAPPTPTPAQESKPAPEAKPPQKPKPASLAQTPKQAPQKAATQKAAPQKLATPIQEPKEETEAEPRASARSTRRKRKKSSDEEKPVAKEEQQDSVENSAKRSNTGEPSVRKLPRIWLRPPKVQPPAPPQETKALQQVQFTPDVAKVEPEAEVEESPEEPPAKRRKPGRPRKNQEVSAAPEKKQKKTDRSNGHVEPPAPAAPENVDSAEIPAKRGRGRPPKSKCANNGKQPRTTTAATPSTRTRQPTTTKTKPATTKTTITASASTTATPATPATPATTTQGSSKPNPKPTPVTNDNPSEMDLDAEDSAAGTKAVQDIFKPERPKRDTKPPVFYNPNAPAETDRRGSGTPNISDNDAPSAGRTGRTDGRRKVGFYSSNGEYTFVEPPRRGDHKTAWQNDDKVWYPKGDKRRAPSPNTFQLGIHPLGTFPPRERVVEVFTKDIQRVPEPPPFGFIVDKYWEKKKQIPKEENLNPVFTNAWGLAGNPLAKPYTIESKRLQKDYQTHKLLGDDMDWIMGEADQPGESNTSGPSNSKSANGAPPAGAAAPTVASAGGKTTQAVPNVEPKIVEPDAPSLPGLDIPEIPDTEMALYTSKRRRSSEIGVHSLNVQVPTPPEATTPSEMSADPQDEVPPAPSSTAGPETPDVISDPTIVDPAVVQTKVSLKHARILFEMMRKKQKEGGEFSDLKGLQNIDPNEGAHLVAGLVAQSSIAKETLKAKAFDTDEHFRDPSIISSTTIPGLKRHIGDRLHDEDNVEKPEMVSAAEQRLKVEPAPQMARRGSQQGKDPKAREVVDKDERKRVNYILRDKARVNPNLQWRLDQHDKFDRDYVKHFDNHEEPVTVYEDEESNIRGQPDPNCPRPWGRIPKHPPQSNLFFPEEEIRAREEKPVSPWELKVRAYVKLFEEAQGGSKSSKKRR